MQCSLVKTREIGFVKPVNPKITNFKIKMVRRLRNDKYDSRQWHTSGVRFPIIVEMTKENLTREKASVKMYILTYFTVQNRLHLILSKNKNYMKKLQVTHFFLRNFLLWRFFLAFLYKN